MSTRGGTTSDPRRLVDVERSVALQCYPSRDPDPLVVAGADGVHIIDADGRRYLDMTAQMASCAVGYAQPEVLAALRRGLDLAIAGTAHVHAGRVNLAEKLLSLAGEPFERVFFGVTGSDAVEAALKFARLRTGRTKVISHWNGYHGATFGALSAHGIAGARHPYEPLLPGFVHVPPPDRVHGDYPVPADEVGAAAVDHVRRTILREGPDSVSAIITEPVFAGGGAIVPPDEYLVGLRSLCDEFGILLIFDEVVTGFGRTGRWFAFQHLGIAPDLLVLGKGLTSGYQALSAVLLGRRADPFGESGSGAPIHIHTLAANPLGCIAAMTTISVIARDHLIENAAARGAQLEEGLRAVVAAHPRVRDVRGRGLLVGLELQTNGEDARALEHRYARACRDRGVFVGGCVGPHPVMVLHPPLTISAEQTEQVTAALTSALDDLD
jgi:taurine--2-oxoglutarate transaminase